MSDGPSNWKAWSIPERLHTPIGALKGLDSDIQLCCMFKLTL